MGLGEASRFVGPLGVRHAEDPRRGRGIEVRRERERHGLGLQASSGWITRPDGSFG